MINKLEICGLTKRFGEKTLFEDLDLTLAEPAVLWAPSGWGKTTLLRMIAGIGPATSGRILMDGKDITDVDPGKRDVAMVFQNYALWPHLSVFENVAFGLRAAGVPKKVIDEIAPKYTDRNGGYTRVVRTGPRRGDAAEMAVIELI